MERSSAGCFQRPPAFAPTIGPDPAGAMQLPGPRDADHIADELHQLLLQAGITGPIVLMGHSIGGIYMRDYATRYPAEGCRIDLCGQLHAVAESEPGA